MTMKHNHPSSWRIIKARPKPGASRSTEYLLPTPAGEDPIVISTFAIFALLRAYHKQPVKPTSAGAFAFACSALLDTHGDLTKFDNITLDADTTVREWLAIYQTACRKHSKGDMLDDRPTDITKEAPKEETPKEETPEEETPKEVPKEPQYWLRESIIIAAVTGFTRHHGLSVDPKQVAAQSKAIADEWELI